MKTLRDRVAVITGAASGLGRALAKRCAREGMKLVLADINEVSLEQARTGLAGTQLLTVGCDVSKAHDVQRLAQVAIESFGAVHVVCNNAGVATLGAVWENTEADWQWSLGVNLWGVIHGVRVFTPILLAQNDEGHIVNTASVAGLIAPPGMGVYNTTKHAVVALTETLFHDLAAKTSQVKCSVVCPAYFASGIADSERNRPADLRSDRPKTPEDLAREANLRKAIQSGKLSADDIADAVLEAVRDERFYVLTHPRIKPAIELRMRDILDGRNPTSPLG
jgi:NAD(P)-dependent dehydrogenase (short-subunit alcohol dehydrogenase family)